MAANNKTPAKAIKEYSKYGIHAGVYEGFISLMNRKNLWKIHSSLDKSMKDLCIQYD